MPVMLNKCGCVLWSVEVLLIYLLFKDERLQNFLNRDIFMYPIHTVNFVLIDALLAMVEIFWFK